MKIGRQDKKLLDFLHKSRGVLNLQAPDED